MCLSLAGPKGKKGLFEPYCWAVSSSSGQAPGEPLLPLLFPEPLPSLHSLDRTQLVRGRNVDSDALDVSELAPIIWESPAITAATAEPGPLSQPGTVILVYNGELLLVGANTKLPSRVVRGVLPYEQHRQRIFIPDKTVNGLFYLGQT